MATCFDLNDEERQGIHVLLQSQQEKIRAEDSRVEGFNIGWNCGEVAGQTVFHAHVHLTPRRKGDVDVVVPVGVMPSVFIALCDKLALVRHAIVAEVMTVPAAGLLYLRLIIRPRHTRPEAGAGATLLAVPTTAVANNKVGGLVTIEQ